MKAEYKSTRDALKELNPFNWRSQTKEIKDKLTPEEYETVLFCIDEYRANCKIYAFMFTTTGLAFNYWQRAFLPRSFYFFTLSMGLFSGYAYASLRTAWYMVERVDALGKDYELSRIVKQDIFDTRPDMDSAQRA